MRRVTVDESEVSAAVQAKLWEVAGVVGAEARRLCPIDTGRLENSLGVLAWGKDYIDFGTRVPYALHVEFGTVHPATEKHKAFTIPPNPFLRAALDIVQ